MNGNKMLLDTNIILYLLNGDQTLAKILDDKQIYISIITELELLAFTGITEKEEKIIQSFLSECKIISINSGIKKEVVRLRKEYKIKLPDTIIIATALHPNLPLITADIEFQKVTELPLIHYQLG